MQWEDKLPESWNYQLSMQLETKEHWSWPQRIIQPFGNWFPWGLLIQRLLSTKKSLFVERYHVSALHYFYKCYFCPSLPRLMFSWNTLFFKVTSISVLSAHFPCWCVDFYLSSSNVLNYILLDLNWKIRQHYFARNPMLPYSHIQVFGRENNTAKWAWNRSSSIGNGDCKRWVMRNR